MNGVTWAEYIAFGVGFFIVVTSIIAALFLANLIIKHDDRKRNPRQ